MPRPKSPAINAHGLFSIEGACVRPHRFSHLDLKSIHRYYQIDDLSKVDERLTGKGVRLRKLIDLAGADPKAGFLVAHSEDGAFTATLPMDVAKSAIIIYERKGKALDRAEDGPVRLVVPFHPDKCGNVKGLGRLVVSHEPGDDTKKHDHSGKAAAPAAG